MKPNISIPPLFILFLASLPFNRGPTLKYILSAMLIAACIFQIRKIASLQKLLVLQGTLFFLACGLLVYFLVTGASIFMAWNMGYTFRYFLEEVVLNLSLYIAFSIYIAYVTPNLPWLSFVKIANAIFLILYVAVMLQWVFVDPQHPWFAVQGLNLQKQTGLERMFYYGRHTVLVHGIKHTSFFLLLGIIVTFVPFLWNKNITANLMLMGTNFFALITTARRAVMLSTVLAMCLSALSRPGAFKKSIATTGAIIFVISGLCVIGDSGYITRGHWSLLLQGKIKEAQEKKDSFGERLVAIIVFGKEIAAHPFKGAGLGRRNIKAAYTETCKTIRLPHAHNFFLNIALETGIQGVFAILLVLGAQAVLLLKSFLRTDSDDRKIILVTGLTFMVAFWLAQMATYGFSHSTSTMYWLFMAIPTGIALSEESQNVMSTPVLQ